MRWFHQHVWKEIGRVFSAPITTEIKLTGDSSLAKAILFGVTTLTLRCTDCGDLKIVEGAGDLRALAANEKQA